MKNALILHGTDDNPDVNWFRWLERELEKKGYKVWVPNLPRADRPNVQRYLKFIRENKDWEFNSETIIIGHSSGAVAALGILQNLPEDVAIEKAILVAAFKDDLDWDALDELFLEPFDFKTIKKRCRKFIFIHSDNDPYCPIDHAEYLSKQVGGELIIREGAGHFNASRNPEFTKFPFILTLL